MGLGLFGGGVGAARALSRRGARVTVTDLKPADALAPSIEALQGLPIVLHLGGHDPDDFTEADSVVVNPAVPRKSPYLAMARRAGAEITAEMTLFVGACPAPLVGVTGSAGKSTTTALLGAMLSQSRTTHVGGNIGKSLLEELDQIRPDDIVVLEMSSFQLDDLGPRGLSPHAAVVTNVSPNHLDRHGSMTAYIDAKKNILRFQGSDDLAVLNADDPEVRDWAGETAGRVLLYSLEKEVEAGGFLSGTEIILRVGDADERIDLAPALRLRGRHNLANALAAAVAARAMGTAPDEIVAAAADFEPLPHRFQPVGTVGGVAFIDDSKATTPRSAAVSMEALEGPIVLIAGGYDKHLDPSPLVEAARRRCRAAVLIGATAAALAEAIGSEGPPLVRADDLPSAVREAARRAKPGDTVLLAPGYASWDMFENYEHRGNVFREAVEELGEKGSP